ncbi:MAG: hypothetical protein KF869_12330 [Phycisphaeraceae bacterium]|nr:hypothetical protein [Phycisphaeraceae bacterium]
MNSVRLIVASSILVAASILSSGCASDQGPTKAADVVPISVNVIPILTDPLKPLLQIETTLNTSGATDCVLLYFYDIRDETGTDPDVHLDTDEFLDMNADSRQRRFSTSGNKYTIFVNAKSVRPIAGTVSVVVMSDSTKKGAFGKASLPAASGQ